jgi:prophage tail gpP-like protein
MSNDVRLLVGGREIRPKKYEIQRNVFTQPCAFAFTIGDAKTAVELVNSVPPNEKFELYIDETLVFVGLTDGVTSQGAAGNGTELSIRGRDMMSPLLGACAQSEETLTEITYAELAEHALKAVLGEGAGFALIHTNDANRKAVTAAKAPTSSRTAHARAVGTEVLIGIAAGGTGGVVAPTASAPATPPAQAPSRTIKIALGEAWYQSVLKPEFDRAGLNMMATGDGNYFLGAPDTTQRPSLKLVRCLSTDDGPSNILAHDFAFETTSRHSSYAVNFRSGGGSTPRKGAGGSIDDEEMKVLGIRRPWVAKDEKIKTVGQADQYVRRKMCDERRSGFSLVYTIRGHSVPGPSGEGIIPAPDTTVEVDDDELDIHTTMYVEAVQMTGFPQLTRLTVCRLSDILNATPEDGFTSE